MTTERKKRRWWIWVLGAIGGTLLLIVIAAYVVLQMYASDIVRATLADADLPNPRLEVESIGLSQSVLSDVAIGDFDEVAARAIEIGYDIFDLIDLDTSDLQIRLVEPVLRVTIDDQGGLSLGSLDRLLEGSGRGESGAMPFERVELQSATLYAETPLGPIVATADGVLTNEGDETLGLNLTVRADSDAVVFDGDLDLLLGPAGAIEGDAVVRALAARTPWAILTEGTGTVSLRWPGEGIPVGEADFTIGSLQIPARLLPAGAATGDEGVTLSGVSVVAAFDGRALSLRARLSDAAGDNSLAVDVAVPDVFAGGQATARGDVTASGDSLPLPGIGDWIQGGSMAASFEAQLTLPALPALVSDPAGLLEQPDGDASVQWLVTDLGLPGIARDVSSVGDVTVSLIDGIATVRSEDPVELRIGGLDQALLDGLVASDPAWEPIVARDFGGHIDVALEGRSSRPMSVTITRDADEMIVRGDVTLLAATGHGPLAAAELSGRLAIGDEVAVRVDDMVLFASDITTPGVSVGVVEAAGSFSVVDGVPGFDVAGAVTDLAFTEPQMRFARLAIELAMAPPESGGGEDAPLLSGPLSMSFSESGGSIDDVRMEGLSGELTGSVSWGDGIAQLFFSENAVFRVDVLDIDGDVIFPESSLLRVQASESPVMELDFTGEHTVIRHSLNIGPVDVRGTVRMGDEHVQVTMTAPQMRYDGGYDDGYVLHIELTGVNANAPARGWTIGGATVTVDYDDNDEENLVVVAVNAARAQSTATEGLLPPIGARMRMDYGLDDVLRFTGRAFDERNFLIADAAAQHDLNTSRGTATVEVQDLIFNPGILQPSHISPVLSGFENVTGTVDVIGGVHWVGSEVIPNLAVHIADVSGEFDEVEFTRMNAVVEFADFSPFRTKLSQLLSIATIDLGVPIDNAEVLFHLEQNHLLIIDAATLELAGGVVQTDAQAIDFEANNQTLDLSVTGVDLNTLLSFAELEDLEAQGTLDGVIPIKIVDGDVVILNARLSAIGPGYIRYNAGEALDSAGESNAGVDLMVEVLRNFLFQELDLTLTRPVAGDMDIGFHILGYNPDVYGGVPIDLTLNLDGELEQVIRNSLEIYRVPEAIQDLILEYGFEAVEPRR